MLAEDSAMRFSSLPRKAEAMALVFCNRDMSKCLSLSAIHFSKEDQKILQSASVVSL